MTTPQDPFGPPGESSGSAPLGGAAGQPAGPPPGPPYGGQPAGQQPYGEQPYGTQPGWGAGPGGHQGPKKNGIGIAALVCGVLALLTSFTVVGGVLFGLAAIVLGAIGRGKAKRGEADNGGVAIAGLVLGVIGLLISAALVAAGVALFSSESGQSLVECLESAGNDQAAVEQCQTDLEDSLGQ